MILSKKNLIPFAQDKSFNSKVINIISKEFLTPLEETRLAIEEIVIAKNISNFI